MRIRAHGVGFLSRSFFSLHIYIILAMESWAPGMRGFSRCLFLSIFVRLPIPLNGSGRWGIGAYVPFYSLVFHVTQLH